MECTKFENNIWAVVALTIISVCSYAFFRMLLPWDVHRTSPMPQHQHMDCSPVNCSSPALVPSWTCMLCELVGFLLQWMQWCLKLPRPCHTVNEEVQIKQAWNCMDNPARQYDFTVEVLCSCEPWSNHMSWYSHAYYMLYTNFRGLPTLQAIQL